MNELAVNTQTNLSIVTASMDQNPAAVFLSHLCPSSRYTCELDLKAISAILGESDPFTVPWGALRFQHTTLIRTKLMELISTHTGKGLALVTINHRLSALRGVMKTAWRLGQMNAEDYYRAVDIENVKGETLPAGRELVKKEITRLMDVCTSDISPVGVRDGAIIALMYSCGLRRNEVTSLDLDDYHVSKEMLVVSGKRRKERTAYLVNEAAIAMMDWIKVRGDREGPLFLPFRWIFRAKNHELIHRRMTTQAIYNILLKRGSEAGITRFSPHDLRRTFVSHLLEEGVDISTVAKMAGHSSVTTTARYDKRPEESKRKAAELLHVKYKARKHS